MTNKKKYPFLLSIILQTTIKGFIGIITWRRCLYWRARRSHDGSTNYAKQSNSSGGCSWKYSANQVIGKWKCSAIGKKSVAWTFHTTWMMSHESVLDLVSGSRTQFCDSSQKKNYYFSFFMLSQSILFNWNCSFLSGLVHDFHFFFLITRVDSVAASTDL